MQNEGQKGWHVVRQMRQAGVRSAGVLHIRKRGVEWRGPAHKEIPKWSFLYSPPWWTANSRAVGSLFLVAAEHFQPTTAGSQDRSAPKATAVLHLIQGSLPMCAPSTAGKLFPYRPSPLSCFFPEDKWQRGKLFGSCHISFQRWWSLG